MNELDKLRMEINEIDRKIAELFETRMETVKKIGEFKREHKLAVLDGAREKELLQTNCSYIQKEELRPYYKEMLVDLMRISKEYQQAMQQ